MSEFNLSSKWAWTEDSKMYPQEDVKEFIRLLKERHKELDMELANGKDWMIAFLKIPEIIDKLAGEELI